MVGSTYLNEVKDYTFLAKYYDELLGDEEGYKYWLEYLELTKDKEILELASGSGCLAKLLFDKGYKILASDISMQMRDVAIENGFRGEYAIIDMGNFSLNKKFDYIMCFCDSFNYLGKDNLLPFFKNVSRHLKEDGTLLFDMHSIKRLKEFANEYIEEGQLSDGCKYQWTILADNYAKSLHENFIFYTGKGIITERHQQFVYTPMEIEKVLESTDLTIEWNLDFIGDEKVMGVVKKK